MRARRTITPPNPLETDPSDDEMVPYTFRHPVGFRLAFDEMIETARMVLGRDAPINDCIEAIIAEGPLPFTHRETVTRQPRRQSDRPLRPPIAIRVRPEDLDHARRTLERVDEYIRDVEELTEDIEPESPQDALIALRQIHLLRAPGRVLLAHLIRDLRRVGAPELLGYASMASMVEELLGISERAARDRVAESEMFESNRGIETAYATGKISTMQAALIRQLKHTDQIDEFVERARETTWRQFQREYRLLTLLRRCNLGRLALRPLSHGDIEEALIQALGGDREAIEEDLQLRGLPAPPPGSPTDPAENPLLMDRLETMVQLLVMREWDEAPSTGAADRQTLAYLRGEMTTRIWLKPQTRHDFKEVLWQVREGSTRYPEWVAMAVLFQEVTRIWTQEDPERRPVHGKILTRDHYRCAVPGCTRRDQLEAHHIEPRSRGGSNAAENLTALCHGHHQHGVHGGHVRIRGRAPHGLTYELGRRRDGTPLLIYRGNRLVRGPFDP